LGAKIVEKHKTCDNLAEHGLLFMVVVVGGKLSIMKKKLVEGLPKPGGVQ
jgi:hypothetical protein